MIWPVATGQHEDEERPAVLTCRSTNGPGPAESLGDVRTGQTTAAMCDTPACRSLTFHPSEWNEAVNTQRLTAHLTVLTGLQGVGL